MYIHMYNVYTLHAIHDACLALLITLLSYTLRYVELIMESYNMCVNIKKLEDMSPKQYTGSINKYRYFKQMMILVDMRHVFSDTIAHQGFS